MREARAAARFQHPNVATVSHYGEQADECFYAMELVEGETLEARVRREGPLPVPLVLEIAVQVAGALEAAEAQGVVHRDLKPTNLMLTGHGDEPGQRGVPLVKIIDFGLAKAVSASGGMEKEKVSETRGGFVGTPAFASPEQFEGSAANEIDGRSDIFSLGVTLWYALCGQPPFAGQDLDTIRAQHFAPLPLEQLTARKVPRRCVELLQSMLAANPADRPPSARDLLERLTVCRGELPRRPAARARRWLTVALILTCICAVVGVWWSNRHVGWPAADQSIAVLPFENLSPDPADAFFTTGIRDEITANLAHIATLKVIDAESVGSYPPGKQDAGRIGPELGVRFLLEGSVRRENGQVHATVRLIDATTSRQIWVETYDRPLADSFTMQGEVTRAIADRLHARLSHDEKAAIDAPPTSDPAAYDLYLRAMEDSDFTVNPPEMLKKFGRSLRLLDEAIARDPKFALAYCAIAGIHDAMYFDLGNTTADNPRLDRRGAAESALHTARRLQPDAGEVHLALAKHLIDVVWDYPQARIEVDLARRTLPNNAVLERADAHLLALGGRWEDSARAMERAATLDPRSPGVFEELETLYRNMRQYENAECALAKLTALTPGEDAFPVRIACAMEAIEARADLAPLRAALASPPAGGGPAGVNVFHFALAYLDRDADALARALAAAPEQHYHVFGADYPKMWYVGLEARLRGDQPSARAAFEAAREPVAASVQADPSYKNASMVSLLSLIDAGLGRTDDAVRGGLNACEMLPETMSTTRPPTLHSNLAIVYAWTGQSDKAIACLKPWIKKPAGRAMIYTPTYGDLKLNPAWDPLRNDPRFLALVEQLTPRPVQSAVAP